MKRGPWSMHRVVMWQCATIEERGERDVSLSTKISSNDWHLTRNAGAMRKPDVNAIKEDTYWSSRVHRVTSPMKIALPLCHVVSCVQDYARCGSYTQ